MSFTGCRPGENCSDYGYIFNDVLPPNIVDGLNELYGCGINPYSFIDCSILTGCTSVLSGLTGPYITGATYNPISGCLTFFRQSGATFSTCGFLTGATSTSSSYWSAGTRGITYTGGSSTYVGVGTEDPNKTLTIKGSVSATTTLDVDGNTTLSTQLNISGNTVTSGNISLTQDSYLYFGYDVNNQTYIREDGSNLVIDANDDILLRPDDDLKIAYGSTQYASFDGSKSSLVIGTTVVPNSRLTVDGTQSGSVSSIAEANDPTSSVALANFFNTRSGTVSTANLFIGEKRSSGTGDFFIYPQGTNAEILINSDLVLGAYKAGTLYSSELLRLKGSTARVGIKNVSPAFDLDVGGSQNATTIYSAGTELSLLFRMSNRGHWSANTAGLIYTGGTSTTVGIGTSVPNKELTVIGSVSATTDMYVGNDLKVSGNLGIGVTPTNALHISTADNVVAKIISTDATATIELSDSNTTNAAAFKRVTDNLQFVPNGGNVGIGTSPVTKLDVHHDPTDISDNTGGGDVITFGIESNANSLSAGTLMWLHTDGYWYNTDADNVASGATNLIAIALGTAVSDGMLINGYYDYSSNLQGTFAKGMACYVSENAGFVDFTAPSGTYDYVRILGYGTDKVNIIYFNPDKTWVELS